MRGGEEEHNEEGLETSEENGGEDEEKEEERSQGCRQVLCWSPETANGVPELEERAHLHVRLHLHPPAGKTKLYKQR